MQNTSIKPIVYMVCGVSGAGKSWVCDQLTDKFYYVSYDNNRKNKHIDLLLNNTTDKPALYDPMIKISTFIKRNSFQFDIRPVFIIEKEEVVRERLEGRGGEFTPYIITRMNAMNKRNAKYGIFSGTSQEVLDYLKNV